MGSEGRSGNRNKKIGPHSFGRPWAAIPVSSRPSYVSRRETAKIKKRNEKKGYKQRRSPHTVCAPFCFSARPANISLRRNLTFTPFSGPPRLRVPSSPAPLRSLLSFNLHSSIPASTPGFPRCCAAVSDIYPLVFGDDPRRPPRFFASCVEGKRRRFVSVLPTCLEPRER